MQTENIYIEPIQADYGLHSAKVEFFYWDDNVANCLDIETDSRKFHNKVVLIPGESNPPKRHLYSVPLFYKEHVNFEVLRRYLNDCVLNYQTSSEHIHEVPDFAADSDTQDSSHSRDPAYTVAKSLGSTVFTTGLDLEQRSSKSG